MPDNKRCCGTCGFWDSTESGIYNPCDAPLPLWTLDADFKGVNNLVRTEQGITCPAYREKGEQHEQA